MWLGKAGTRLFLLTLSCVLGLAACSGASLDGEPGEILLRVETMESGTLAGFPLILLYGDGRLVIRPVDHGESVLPEVTVRRLESEAVQRVLDRAADAGLTGDDRRLAFEPQFNGPITTISTVGSDGPTKMEVEQIEGLLAPTSQPFDVRDDRLRVLRFYTSLFYASDWLPEDGVGAAEPFEFDRLMVLSSPGVANPSIDADARVDWPLTKLSAAGMEVDEKAPWNQGRRCQVIEGADLGKVLEVTRVLPNDFVWMSAGQPYFLEFQPLLDGEDGCEGRGQP